MAFVNHNTKEIVIATAGTKPSDAMDLLDDLGLLFGLVPSKMSSITSFLHRIKEELGDDFKNYETITTGHSLGSTLSDLTAVKAKDMGYNVFESITFDSPGSGPIIKAAKKQGYISKDVDISDIEFDVTDATPNLINTTNLDVSSAEINMVVPQPEIKQKTEEKNKK